MTRKDYVAIAAALKAEITNCEYTGRELEVVRGIAFTLADVFIADNPLFWPDAFMDAIFPPEEE